MKQLTSKEVMEIYSKRINYQLANRLYQKNKDLYEPSQCYNNAKNFLIYDEKRNDMYYCYGVVLSGLPRLNGVAVYHGWIEEKKENGSICDVTMIANAEPEDKMSGFIFFPWKKFTAAEYQKILVDSYNGKQELPDVQLKKDSEFRTMIEEEMGYQCLG